LTVVLVEVSLDESVPVMAGWDAQAKVMTFRTNCGSNKSNMSATIVALPDAAGERKSQCGQNKRAMWAAPAASCRSIPHCHVTARLVTMGRCSGYVWQRCLGTSAVVGVGLHRTVNL
jgi:hypothetical protein